MTIMLPFTFFFWSDYDNIVREAIDMQVLLLEGLVT
jgi:hypothetical protein